MALAHYAPALWNAAHAALSARPKAPCSTILVMKLPGWGERPITFDVTRDTFYVYLEAMGGPASGLRLAICG